MTTNRSNHSDDSFGEWSVDPSESDTQPSADTPANAWSAVDESRVGASGYQTQSFQPQQVPQQPEPYRPASYVPAPQAGPAAAPSNDNKGLTIAVIVLAIIAVALLVGAMAYFYFSNSQGVNSASGTSSESQQVQSTTSEETSTTSTSEQKRRAEDFTPPSNWQLCSGSGDPGDLNLVYAENVGGNITTCPFATNVRNAFVEHYQVTKKLNGTVTANSPKTGKTYTMTCRDNGDVVTCTGGTNATVHIV
ncbi:hypothetical protein [uncultured Corynebacterium sp.]|uniref:hypothetical protein n=1 Tax=uncultured Corynebacterium sp. TaxID=159447 RepID=UPI002619DF47|nr:hypothetical protein [uncultured Corynebacterium sp.]